jgi:putative phage-type endonuclease
MELYAPEKFNEAKLLGVFESGSSEWHEVRADGIGGSEVGTIMGLNQWESAYYLWASKTGQLPPKVIDSFPAWLGTNLEPFILGPMLSHLHPDWEIFTTGTYQHPKLPFLHANPDALAKVNGEWIIVEAKTSRNYWSEVPPSYVAQVQHYMNILGVKRAVIVGLVAMDPVEYWIEADSFEQQVIEQMASEFWNCVLTGTAPDWDGSESTYEAVREMHPDIDGTEVEIDGIHSLVVAQLAFDQAEAELRKQKSEVLAMMGKAQHAVTEYEGKTYRVASRQARGAGKPFLIVHKGKK